MPAKKGKTRVESRGSNSEPLSYDEFMELYNEKESEVTGLTLGNQGWSLLADILGMDAPLVLVTNRDKSQYVGMDKDRLNAIIEIAENAGD